MIKSHRLAALVYWSRNCAVAKRVVGGLGVVSVLSPCTPAQFSKLLPL